MARQRHSIEELEPLVPLLTHKPPGPQNWQEKRIRGGATRPFSPFPELRLWGGGAFIGTTAPRGAGWPRIRTPGGRRKSSRTWRRGNLGQANQRRRREFRPPIPPLKRIATGITRSQAQVTRMLPLALRCREGLTDPKKERYAGSCVVGDRALAACYEEARDTRKGSWAGLGGSNCNV